MNTYTGRVQQTNGKLFLVMLKNETTGDVKMTGCCKDQLVGMDTGDEFVFECEDPVLDTWKKAPKTVTRRQKKRLRDEFGERWAF